MQEASTPYDRLGGEAVVWLVVDKFYNVMDSEPSVAPLRQMHPDDLESSRQKLFMFLSGWLGGPNLFVEKFGHPRLRARHMPFAVDAAARDQWMYCMRQAFADIPADEALKRQLLTAIGDLADFMRNQA